MKTTYFKGLILYGLQLQAVKIRLLTGAFILLRNITMKSYALFYKEQFKKCQATIAKFDVEGLSDAVTIFYSYTCPELVKVRGDWYKFSYENSRKAGCITGSHTTSKQLTRYFGPEWRDLPVMNLKDFENEYFYTGIDGLY